MTMREDISNTSLIITCTNLEGQKGKATVDKQIRNATIRILATTFINDLMPLNPVFSTAC
jgi:hypothetical protein